MKYIKLSNTNNVTFVDDEDFPLLNRYTWRIDPKGYAVTSLCGTTLRMHRFILNPSKFEQLDHKNQDKLDNRKANLRICNNIQNQANTSKRKVVGGKKTSSKYKGVHWRKDMGKWASRIGDKGKRIYLGYYDNEEEAAIAYNKKALELWGEFASINQIKGE